MKCHQHDPTPTTALPGTPEKVEVLIRRARLGYHLFHPLDAGMPGEADEVATTIPLPEPARHVAEAV
jgi:hypothetical protein